MNNRRFGFFLVAALTVFAVSAGASTWGGHNGTISLSFSDSAVVHVLNDVDTIPNVGVIVDLYALLDDLAPLTYKSEKILALGGFELKLKIEGCEFQVLSQQFPLPMVNVHPELGHCLVGLSGALSTQSGPTQLVHWQIRLMGDVRNVKFSLDPGGLASCNVLDGCRDSGSYALWAGSADANQLGLIFSAGVIPAYLNWSASEPDLSILRGRTDWDERGLFESY